MSLFSVISSLFSRAPASANTQPDWLASVKTVADSAIPSIAHHQAPFVSPTARPLSDADLNKVSASLGVLPAALKAVREVEAAGKGFLSDKRPTILFEAHIFSRETGHRYDVSHPNISSKSWNRASYGKGGANQFDRLQAAIKLDRTAALKSASWGLFQIMGFNHATSGFKDVESFVASMCKDELQHLEAVASFIRANPSMHKALKNRDWATFARLYNGKEYKVNKYDTKLASAFKRFS